MNWFYKASDYRKNENSPHIVYDSAVEGAGTVITRHQFLAENPHMGPEDFDYWKRCSDNDYLNLLNHDRREGAKHQPMRDELAYHHADLAMEDWIGMLETRLEMQDVIKAELTNHEARRLIAYWFCGYSVVEIAKMENATKGAISQSISNAMEKLKNILGQPKLLFSPTAYR